ncbi:MAG TPA: hypothetical protein VMJ30_02530, partial [Gemmatimonadales bacterium]|nr:hypothetical protein [Gemmatimonadales bacterium]
MIRSFALACGVALVAGTSSAQQTELPPVARSTCSRADSILGRPKHEDMATLLGEYDSQRDSTYLYAVRQPRIERSFVPSTSRILAGSGPFEVSGLLLVLSVNSDARGIKNFPDTLPVTLELDDLTRIHPGNLRIGKLSEMGYGPPVVQVSIVLTPAALQALLHSKSAVLRWGHWHADLEESDIGVFRAFQRTLMCAPASLPYAEAGGVVRNAGTAGHVSTMREAWVVDGPWGTQLLLYHNTDRISCPLADRLLGSRRDEDAGWLGGKYDKRHDSTYVLLQERDRGLALKYQYETPVHFAGSGPYAPNGLALGFRIQSTVSNAVPWSDTMAVTLVLDDSITRHAGTLHLTPASGECCAVPLHVAIE